jgi:hypothetical protein
MANSAFHNRNTCHQENSNDRQICAHQRRQATNRHNHRIEILEIPAAQSRRLQSQGQPQPSAQHQRRPVCPCRRMLINAGRLRHYPITPQKTGNHLNRNGDYHLNHRYPLTIMKYAQLIRLLVARELTLRYKRSVIGIGWTLLNPMLTSFVLWVVFSFVFASRLPSGQQFAPYLMAGILLNTFFNQGLMQSAESIASNGGVLNEDLCSTTNLCNLGSTCWPR